MPRSVRGPGLRPLVPQQRVLGPPLHSGAARRGGAQPLHLAGHRLPLQGARHFLLVLGHGAVHQGPARLRHRSEGDNNNNNS